MSNLIIIDTERCNCCSQLSTALVADPQIKAKNHFQITEFPLFWNLAFCEFRCFEASTVFYDPANWAHCYHFQLQWSPSLKCFLSAGQLWLSLASPELSNKAWTREVFTSGKTSWRGSWSCTPAGTLSSPAAWNSCLRKGDATASIIWWADTTPSSHWMWTSTYCCKYSGVI